MSTLRELTSEYEALRIAKDKDKSALDELKPKLTTLNHIKYNFDILTRDDAPNQKDLQRSDRRSR